MDSPNFDVKARIPVRPLSYENKDKAVPKELIIDYTNGSVYITDSEGNIIAIGGNSDTVKSVIDYLIANPTVITEEITISLNGQDVPLSDAIYGHGHHIASADRPGFISISSQVKLDNIEDGANKTIVDEAIDEGSTNPVQNKAIYEAFKNYLALSGGNSTKNRTLSDHTNLANNVQLRAFNTNGVPMVIAYMGTDNKIHFGSTEEAVGMSFDGPIILGSKNFGTELPENPTEGLLFFKIIEES